MVAKRGRVMHVWAAALALSLLTWVAVWEPAHSAPDKRCQGQLATIAGTDEADQISGSPNNDVIVAGRGADTIHGGGGDDVICGEEGDDILDGGDSGDTLSGGRGNDWATYVDAPARIAYGRLGRYGSSGEIGISGDFEDDLFGIENIEGTSFDDVIGGGDGNNTLRMGGGNDKFVWDFTDVGDDTWDGGPGQDIALYYRVPGPVHVDLAAKVEIPAAPSAGTDTLIGVETVGGSAFPDEFRGNDEANRFLGSTGPGGDAGAYLLDSHEANTMQGGGGDDRLLATGGAHVLNGGAGNDFLVGGEGNDQLFGEDGDDQINGGGGNDQLDGGPGMDVLSGGYGSDTCTGEADDATAHCASRGNPDESIDRPNGPLEVSDLALTVVEPTEAGEDGQLIYELTVTNLGPDTLPAASDFAQGLLFFSGGLVNAATGSPGFNCYRDDNALNIYNYAGCWNSEPLAAGASVTSTIEVCPFERVAESDRVVCSPKDPQLTDLDYSAVMLSGFAGLSDPHIDPVWENNLATSKCIPPTVYKQFAQQQQACALEPFIVVSPTSLDGAIGSLKDAGVLDFANQPIGLTSSAQKLTISNGSFGELEIINLEIDNDDPDFTKPPSGDDCEGHKIALGESCTVEVYFTPADVGLRKGTLTIHSNDPKGPRTVALSGTGTKLASIAPLSAEPLESALGAKKCGKYSGWRLYREEPRELAGQVIQGHVTTDDFARNHYSQDYNFFVYPDAKFRGLLAPGNFKTGDPHEFGRMEIEWERRTRAKYPGAYPIWAWPTQGDRVYVVGSHIFDCGHGGAWGPFASLLVGEGYRSEIHPPRLVVTYRNAGLAPFGGAQARIGSYHNVAGAKVPATRADVFASSHGGLVLSELHDSAIRSVLADWRAGTGWWQPVNDRDYTFKVLAPPKPNPDAVLDHWQTDRSDPKWEQPQLEFEKLEHERGYQVTIRFSAVKGKEDSVLAIGKTIWVGWRDVDTPPELRGYRVTITSLGVQEELTGDWGLYAYVNERSGTLLESRTTSLFEPYRTINPSDCIPVGSDDVPCRLDLGDASFDIYLVEGQPLHIQFRATAFGILTHDLAGIIEDIYTGDDAMWLGTHASSSKDVMAAGKETVDDECDEGVACFTVTYRIDRL